MSWRNGVVKISAISREDQKAKSVGTGFLVTPSLILSAWHVVSKEDGQPWDSKKVELRATFNFSDSRPLQKQESEIHIEEHDQALDWVLLRCDDVPSFAQQLNLVENFKDSSALWNSCGFPEEASDQMLFLSGTVTEHSGEFNNQHMLQLLSPQVAAAQGLRARGLSGAPVVVRRAALGAPDDAEDITIGMLQTQHSLMGRSQAGTLYARPCTAFLKNSHLPDYDAKHLAAIRWFKRLFVRLTWAVLTPLQQYSLYIFAVFVFFVLPFLVLYWPEEWVVRNYLPDTPLEPSTGFASDKFTAPSFAGKQEKFEQAELLLGDWKSWTTKKVPSDEIRKKYLVATYRFNSWYHAFDRRVNISYQNEDSKTNPVQLIEAAAFLVDEGRYSDYGVDFPRYRQQLVFIDRARIGSSQADSIRPPHIYIQPPNKNESLLLLLIITSTAELPADPSDYSVTLTKS